MSCISVTTGSEGDSSFRRSGPPARRSICTYTNTHNQRQTARGASGFNAEDERVCERLTICVEQHEEHMRRMRVNAEEKLPTVGDSTEDSRLLLRSSSSPSGPRFSSSRRLLSVFMHRPGCVSTVFFTSPLYFLSSTFAHIRTDTPSNTRGSEMRTSRGPGAGR